jgi:hypothetical protein
LASAHGKMAYRKSSNGNVLRINGRMDVIELEGLRMKSIEQNHLSIGCHGKVIRERETWICTQNLRSAEKDDLVWGTVLISREKLIDM